MFVGVGDWRMHIGLSRTGIGPNSYCPKGQPRSTTSTRNENPSHLSASSVWPTIREQRLAKCCKIEQGAHLYSTSFIICLRRYIYIQHFIFAINNTHSLSSSAKIIFIQQESLFYLTKNLFNLTNIFFIRQ